MSGRPTRVVALGYQGFGNLGDEAILCGIEQLLDGERVEVVAIIGGSEPIPAFPDARRIVTRRLLPRPAALLALARADALMFSGGGLLHDHWLSTVPRYLGWTLVARLLRCRVVWVGVGLGPLRRRVMRALAGLALRLSSCVTVRDEASATLAREVGGRVTAVIPDPALNLRGPEGGDGGDELAVVVRPPVGGQPGPAEALRSAIAGLLAEEGAAGRRGAILTFGGARDRAFASSVADAVVQLGAPAPTVDELLPDPEGGLRRVARARLVVTVRLHGMILAAIAGRPFAAIAYDPKVSGVADALDAADVVVDPGSLDTPALVAACERAMAPATRQRIADRVEALTANRPATAGLLGRCLRGEA